MGCGGSRDVVVEMPRKAPRRASLPSAAEERKGSATELFSRPGSGPVVLSPECRGRKNKIGIENNTNGSSTSPTTVGSFGDTIRSPLADKNSSKETRLVNTGSTKTVLPKIESSSPPKAYLNEDYRKGSAQSKASQDSGIGEDQLKPAVLPPVTSSSPVTLPAIESKNGGSGQSGGLVPRLASEEILSQLNEIGIVPLKTNRCGSSLAFNIELDNGSKHPHSSNSEDEVRGGGVGAGAGGEGRMLPPLPPNRLHRLNSLPPIQPPSMEVLDAKQKKAEQRRKNRDEKIRQKSEKLRQRRLSETELSERDDDMKEKVSQDIQQKQQLIEQNKQKLKEAQEERKRRNEERLQRVRMNKEKLMMNGGGGYGDKLDDSYSDPIESGAIDTGDQSDLDGSGDVGKLNDATGGNGLPGAGGDIRGTQRNIVEGTNAAGEPNEDDIF